MSDQKRESIGAIWVKRSGSGAEYFSISLNGENYVAFANKYKKEDRHPDYRIFQQQPLERPRYKDASDTEEPPF